VQFRPPQGLVGIDVADAADQRLVEQCALDARTASPQRSVERRLVERWVEGVRRDVGNRARQPGSGVYGLDGKSAEGALIDEPQLWSGVSEVDQNPQMGLPRCVSRLHEQLTAHAEVRDERLVRGLLRQARTSVGSERDPQILAAPRGLEQPPTRQPRGEVRCAWNVPAYRAGMEHVHGGDDSAGDETGQPAADDLDFGKFGHSGSVLIRRPAT
jgi:hypothetical protein